MADWDRRTYGTSGYNAIMGEIRMDDFTDPWATGLEWLFALAQITYVESGEILPEFGPSPMTVVGDRDTIDDCHAHMILFGLLDSGLTTLDDMATVFTIMSRFVQWCRIAGRDY